jgi:hypothetical protein
MKFNPETNEIYCFGCNKWVYLYTETYAENEQRRCLAQSHILGYDFDPQIRHIVKNEKLAGEEDD